MNVVILKGNLTNNPELRGTETAVAKFTVAVPRIKKGETDFIKCAAFGKTAEFVAKYFQKGQQILLRGHILTGSYENNEGKKVYTTDVIADEVEFCGGKGEGQTEAPKPREEKPDFVGVAEESEEGLPFN